jgi:hypothetical protein
VPDSNPNILIYTRLFNTLEVTVVVLVLLGDHINELVWVTSVCWVTTVAVSITQLGVTDFDRFNICTI